MPRNWERIQITWRTVNKKKDTKIDCTLSDININHSKMKRAKMSCNQMKNCGIYMKWKKEWSRFRSVMPRDHQRIFAVLMRCAFIRGKIVFYDHFNSTQLIFAQRSSRESTWAIYNAAMMGAERERMNQIFMFAKKNNMTIVMYFFS